MNSIKQNIGSIIFAGLLLVIVAVLGYLNVTNNSLASVATGEEYQAREFNANGASTSTLKTMPGAIGSVVVTLVSSSTATSSMRFYDTTLSATTTHASTTILFTLPPSGLSSGTYTFDVGFTRGLLVETTAGFNGRYVVTYK